MTVKAFFVLAKVLAEITRFPGPLKSQKPGFWARSNLPAIRTNLVLSGINLIRNRVSSKNRVSVCPQVPLEKPDL